MSVSRRDYLKVLGGGFIVAAGGLGGWAATREPKKAVAPWLQAGMVETDPRRRALSYAILAPNPHNRQPWVVSLVGTDEIILTCDLARRLPVTDPQDRQITIGLGAFLEIFGMAAAQDGYRAEITAFPEGEPFPRLDSKPVAHVRMVPDPAVVADPLFRHVLDRRTNKEAYDTARPISADILRQLAAAAMHGSRIDAEGDPQRVARFRALAVDGMRTELTTPAALEESLKLTRIGKREIEANPDGVDIGGAFFEAVTALGLLDRGEMLDTASSTYRQMEAAILAPMQTAMAYVWVTTPANERVDQITAGRDYVRLNLKATELGIGIHPQSQTLQEFEAMAGHFQQMRSMTGTSGAQRVQMFCRLGYGPTVSPSPRWPAASRIVQA